MRPAAGYARVIMRRLSSSILSGSVLKILLKRVSPKLQQFHRRHALIVVARSLHRIAGAPTVSGSASRRRRCCWWCRRPAPNMDGWPCSGVSSGLVRPEAVIVAPYPYSSSSRGGSGAPNVFADVPLPGVSGSANALSGPASASSAAAPSCSAPGGIATAAESPSEPPPSSPLAASMPFAAVSVFFSPPPAASASFGLADSPSSSSSSPSESSSSSSSLAAAAVRPTARLDLTMMRCFRPSGVNRGRFSFFA
mmetsp:Transcript_8121/g.25319  ORF Transcript_8121/g.25319 Transcript_8121/m.25319 type:complete len:252 (+) Transcript_8121:994-1749(+)